MRLKEIVIISDEEYQRFLKKIKLYKSPIYYRTIFKLSTNNDKEELDYIVKALNIKKRKDRITYIYDTCCEIADNNVKNINICGFKNSKCYVQRKKKSSQCNGCCIKCLYQSSNGCTTKNLACKLFNCEEVKKRHPVVTVDNLKLLSLLSLKNRFIVKSDYFSKREDVLKDLYSYSLFYSTIRIVLRIIKSYFTFKRKSQNIVQ